MNMGTAEKNLYKEYQKRLKEKGIKQLTNEMIGNAGWKQPVILKK